MNNYLIWLIAIVVVAIVGHWVLWVYVIRPRIRKHQEELSKTMDKIEREQLGKSDSES